MIQPRKVFSTLTVNSVMWLVLGIGFMAFSAYVFRIWRMYPFAVGIFSFGVGGILCGLTNGFTDHSANGRILKRFGQVALGFGAFVAIYYMARLGGVI